MNFERANTFQELYWIFCVWCSILGGFLLVGGLYFVLWGKSKEQKISEGLKEGTKECNMEEGKDSTKLPNENPTSSVENVWIIYHMNWYIFMCIFYFKFRPRFSIFQIIYMGRGLQV